MSGFCQKKKDADDLECWFLTLGQKRQESAHNQLGVACCFATLSSFFLYFLPNKNVTGNWQSLNQTVKLHFFKTQSLCQKTFEKCTKCLSLKIHVRYAPLECGAPNKSSSILCHRPVNPLRIDNCSDRRWVSLRCGWGV